MIAFSASNSRKSNLLLSHNLQFSLMADCPWPGVLVAHAFGVRSCTLPLAIGLVVVGKNIGNV